MFDFGISYKKRLLLEEDWDQSWDYFVSTYNTSERVLRVFDKVRAAQKVWMICPQYGFSVAEHPTGEKFVCDAYHEAEFINRWSDSLPSDFSSRRLCLDLTGFIRPTLLYLIRVLRSLGFSTFDAIYSEPRAYKAKEWTEFASGYRGEVRQVSGFEGVHNAVNDHDLLVIGSGYDADELGRVAYSKDAARKVQILGLPSLRADMYQENELKVALAEDAVGSGKTYFAPAYDPFVTADVLVDIVQESSGLSPISNLYLAPLASKPQVLGFALYYLRHWDGKAGSIIFPVANRYARETSVGIARVWQYSVEF